MSVLSAAHLGENGGSASGAVSPVSELSIPDSVLQALEHNVTSDGAQAIDVDS